MQALKTEEMAIGQGIRVASEAEIGKETESPLEPPERNKALSMP